MTERKIGTMFSAGFHPAHPQLKYQNTNKLASLRAHMHHAQDTFRK